MAKQKGPLLDNLDGSTSYWQVRFKSAECKKPHPYKPSSQDTDDSGVILLAILFTIGFLALIVITTLRTIL